MVRTERRSLVIGVRPVSCRLRGLLRGAYYLSSGRFCKSGGSVSVVRALRGSLTTTRFDFDDVAAETFSMTSQAGGRFGYETEQAAILSII